MQRNKSDKRTVDAISRQPNADEHRQQLRLSPLNCAEIYSQRRCAIVYIMEIKQHRMYFDHSKPSTLIASTHCAAHTHAQAAEPARVRSIPSCLLVLRTYALHCCMQILIEHKLQPLEMHRTSAVQGEGAMDGDARGHDLMALPMILGLR
jgi:hypothetical protein